MTNIESTSELETSNDDYLFECNFNTRKGLNYSNSLIQTIKRTIKNNYKNINDYNTYKINITPPFLESILNGIIELEDKVVDTKLTLEIMLLLSLCNINETTKFLISSYIINFNKSSRNTVYLTEHNELIKKYLHLLESKFLTNINIDNIKTAPLIVFNKINGNDIYIFILSDEKIMYFDSNDTEIMNDVISDSVGFESKKYIYNNSFISKNNVRTIESNYKYTIISKIYENTYKLYDTFEEVMNARKIN
jgi:hypothetical protein